MPALVVTSGRSYQNRCLSTPNCCNTSNQLTYNVLQTLLARSWPAPASCAELDVISAPSTGCDQCPIHSVDALTEHAVLLTTDVVAPFEFADTDTASQAERMVHGHMYTITSLLSLLRHPVTCDCCPCTPLSAAAAAAAPMWEPEVRLHKMPWEMTSK